MPPLPHGTPYKGVEELPALKLGFIKIRVELAGTCGMSIVNIPNDKSIRKKM
jgi:hypothetical protein